MMADSRVFRRSDPDFPTTKAVQAHLVAAGRVEGERPLADRKPDGKASRPLKTSQPSMPPAPPIAPASSIPLGDSDKGTIHLDLNRLLAGRCLIQGSSGAGKSATLRHIVEEAHDFLTTIIMDPEGEFGNLAEFIGAATVRAREITSDGLTATALRARHHRLPLHLDLSDLEPDARIQKAAAFLAGLMISPRKDWANTVMVVIDEAHLLAPHLAASARDAETRRLGVATLTDLCARGRKRGIAPVIATQRLAKLAASVQSELQNVLIGLNVFDRDIARAAELLGFGPAKAAALRNLLPGEFFAFGPALCHRPTLVRVSPSVTTHVGATPALMASADLSVGQAHGLLELDRLQDLGIKHDPAPMGKGIRAIDNFLLHSNAGPATQIVVALRTISPNASTATDLARHVGVGIETVNDALDLLGAIGAVDTMPRGETRIARLSTRLRLRTADVPVVGLA